MDCLLCKMKKESIIHVYTECEYTNSIFNDFCKVNNIVRVNNFDDIIYLKSDSAEEREKISIFKLIIWKMRMRAFRNQGHGKDVFFMVTSKPFIISRKSRISSILSQVETGL